MTLRKGLFLSAAALGFLGAALATPADARGGGGGSMGGGIGAAGGMGHMGGASATGLANGTGAVHSNGNASVNGLANGTGAVNSTGGSSSLNGGVTITGSHIPLRASPSGGASGNVAAGVNGSDDANPNPHLSAAGLANTNGRFAPQRTFGRDRAAARHTLHHTRHPAPPVNDHDSDD